MTSGMSMSSPRSVGSGEDGMGFSRVSMFVGRVEGGEEGVVFLFFLWGGMAFLQDRKKKIVNPSKLFPKYKS